MICCIACPHCGEMIEIIELNCCIFRHAVYKHNLEQMNPHAPREECERAYATGAIYGCGRPFRIVVTDVWQEGGTRYVAEICDYI